MNYFFRSWISNPSLKFLSYGYGIEGFKKSPIWAVEEESPFWLYSELNQSLLFIFNNQSV